MKCELLFIFVLPCASGLVVEKIRQTIWVVVDLQIDNNIL